MFSQYVELYLLNDHLTNLDLANEDCIDPKFNTFSSELIL